MFSERSGVGMSACADSLRITHSDQMNSPGWQIVRPESSVRRSPGLLGGPGRLDRPVVGDVGREAEHPVRVLVVDDHPAFRRALTSALCMVEDIEVAGEAEGGVAACTEAESLRPDVVLMDLSMPDISGIDAMRRIHETQPELPVVILTAFADDAVAREALDAGASGFVAKGTALREIVGTLHHVAAAAS
jgi:CheY-like chemotaxis protein